MTGRGNQGDELRARFTANRERVRSWTGAWEIPEIVWTDEFSEVPSPWIVPERERASWLKRHAPFLDEYDWMFLGRPLTPGVREVRVQWHFGAAHRFEKLDLTIISVCDPGYLAEKLTLAVHHAGLKGWRAEDAQPLYQWLVDGVGTTPVDNGVRGDRAEAYLKCAPSALRPAGSAATQQRAPATVCSLSMTTCADLPRPERYPT